MIRSIFVVILIASYGVSSLAQSILRPEMEERLTDKTEFQQIKVEINGFYEEKLAQSRMDSTALRTYQREYKKWNRILWWSENFTAIDGTVEKNAVLRMTSVGIEERRKNERHSQRHQAELWEHDGPESSAFDFTTGEGMGRFDRLAFHPTDPDIVYAGSVHGGLFQTFNGGQGWTPISAYVPTLGVSGIGVSQQDADVIYILSGDGDSSSGGFVYDYLYESRCTGVYKTTNGGTTWKHCATFPGLTEGEYRGRQLAIDPTDDDRVYAATSEGLFRTTNGGNSWTLISAEQNIWDVKLDPGDAQDIYFAGGHQFFRSLDGGDTYSEIGISGLADATRISIAVTPANTNRVLLLAGSSSDNACIGIFRSTNGGSSFSHIHGNSPNLFFNYIDDDVTTGQYNYNNTIAISSVDADIVLVGGLCVWGSADGGDTWEQETAYWAFSDALNEYIHPDQHMLAFQDDGTAYCANDGGVYRSTDNGDDWDFMEFGLTATQFYHFEPQNDEGDTWGGAQDNGILEREDGTDEFYNYWNGDGYDVMTDHPWRADNGDSDDIYYTVNESIRSDGTDISVPNNTAFFGNLAMDPEEEDIIYVGYPASVYKSPDAGETWNNTGNFPGNWCISTCPTNADRIYAAGSNGSHTGIFRRDGATWQDITSALASVGYNTAQKITDMEVSMNTSNAVFISCGGFVAGSKVYQTTNGGAAWTNISFNLPDVPVFSIVRDVSNGLYVGTGIGVYYKRQGVDHWEPFYNGLPLVPVTQIHLYGADVLISTFGRGLWKTQQYDTNCSETLNLTNSPRGKRYYEVDTQITSSQNISEDAGSRITYNAGTTILLQPGFKSPSGTWFKTFLTGCGGQVDED